MMKGGISSQTKVAICQSAIAPGGRLHVILAMVKVLNELGITPDIVSAALFVDIEKLATQYGSTHNFHFRSVPTVPKIRNELAIVSFNASLRYYIEQYDLLINSSNSLLFLPKEKKVISYIHYPRESRITAPIYNLHLPPHLQPKLSLRTRMLRPFLRLIYRFRQIHAQHKIICNSEFTCDALRQQYTLLEPPEILYPPVELNDFRVETQFKQNALISVGRFSPNKRQIEQIQLAEKMPDIPFHIVGFANDNYYYRQCKEYVADKKIENVKLHPDISFSEMVQLLKRSKFFLHTLINEPFGITAVQAIAAGCIPIVHDSGGQREVVPYHNLRYQSLTEVPSLISKLSQDLTVNQLRKELQQHIQLYDASVFHSRLLRYLQQLSW